MLYFSAMTFINSFSDEFKSISIASWHDTCAWQVVVIILGYMLTFRRKALLSIQLFAATMGLADCVWSFDTCCRDGWFFLFCTVRKSSHGLLSVCNSSFYYGVNSVSSWSGALNKTKSLRIDRWDCWINSDFDSKVLVLRMQAVTMVSAALGNWITLGSMILFCYGWVSFLRNCCKTCHYSIQMLNGIAMMIGGILSTIMVIAVHGVALSSFAVFC